MVVIRHPPKTKKRKPIDFRYSIIVLKKSMHNKNRPYCALLGLIYAKVYVVF